MDKVERKHHQVYHGTTDQIINQSTYKGLRSKPSNTILSLKICLIVSDIDGIEHLLQTIHSLCQNVETSIQSQVVWHPNEYRL